MATWPTDLPLPLQNYGLSFSSTCDSVQFDSMRIRQLLQMTDSICLISVNYRFTNDEYAIFKAFVADTLDQGNNFFNINLITGESVIEHQARFVGGDYKSQYIPENAWLVSAQLECFEIDCFANADDTASAWYCYLYNLLTNGFLIHESLMSLDYTYQQLTNLSPQPHNALLRLG